MLKHQQIVIHIPSLGAAARKSFFFSPLVGYFVYLSGKNESSAMKSLAYRRERLSSDPFQDYSSIAALSALGYV